MYPIVTFWRALRKEGQKRVYTALSWEEKEIFPPYSLPAPVLGQIQL